MIHIQRFIDKIATADGRMSKDIVMPAADAKGLRDEITLLLLELREAQNKNKSTRDPLQVELRAGKW